MKKLLMGLLVCSSFLGFAQKQFEKMPEGAKEIHFTYRLKSKVYIDDSGIYADSLFFKKYFPGRKFSQVEQTKERFLNSFVQWSSVRRRDKEKMVAILYHENELYKGIHFIKENRTVINAIRDDAEVRMYFKEYFRKEYSVFKFKVELDYNDRMKYIKYPLASYQFKFDEVQKDIIWISNTQGTFEEVINKERDVHVALFDENLSKYVSLGHVLSNSASGLVAVESMDTILELTEVYYK